MGRKTLTILILAVAALLLPLSAKASDGLETLVTSRDGGVYETDGAVSGMPEGAEAYEIRHENKRLLTVTQFGETAPKKRGAKTAALPVWYSAEFELPGEEGLSVFLTGLTENNVDEVREKLLGWVYDGTVFSLQSFDFIDAEKADNKLNAGDTTLCWAAVASDMLWYAGWGAKAGFESEDDIFRYFVNSFNDVGSNVLLGIQWFFSGIYDSQYLPDSSHVKDYGFTGRFFPEYAVSALTEHTASDVFYFREMTDRLRNGEAVSASIVWFTGDESQSGHVVALWGYVYDTRFESERRTDINAVKAVIISDPDSDKLYENGAYSPNKFDVIHVTPTVRGGGMETFQFGSEYADNGMDAVLEYYTSLKRYSDELEKETDPDASLDVFRDLDFTISSVDTVKDGVSSDVFRVGDEVSLYVTIVKDSDLPFQDFLSLTVEAGDEKISGMAFLHYEDCLSFITLHDIILPAFTEPGEYPVRVTVNPDKAVKEAHYYDNVFCTTITVADEPPELSGVSFSAAVGAQDKETVPVTFVCENEDALFGYMGKGCITYLFASYFEDGEWSDWEAINPVFDVFPEGVDLFANVEKVKFKTVTFHEHKITQILYSDEYFVEQYSVCPFVSENNTGEYTPLPYGAAALSAGEVFAFDVYNTSSRDLPGKTFDVAVLAVKQGGFTDAATLYSEEGLSLAAGEEPLSFTLSDWTDTGETLSGVYTVYALVSGEFGVFSEPLGVLKVKEPRSTCVNVFLDVSDDYDCVTSLREAVAACGENDVVTSTPEMQYFYLLTPLVIDKKVNIDFSFENPVDPTGSPHGKVIYTDQKTGLIKVTETGVLNARGIVFSEGHALENGGGVLIDGGEASLSFCTFYNCKSGRTGGGICVKDGGRLILETCSMFRCESGYGGAIAVLSGSEVYAHNCQFFENVSGAGAVFSAGTFAAVNSTFASDTCRKGVVGGNTVTTEGANGRASLIKCIVTGENALLYGNVSVYACVLGDASFAGDANGSAVGVTEDVLFKMNAEKKIVWSLYGRGSNVVFHPTVSKLARLPGRVANIDGKTAIVYDGAEHEDIITDVPAVFTDEALLKDACGNDIGDFCGSEARPMNGVELGDADGDGVLIYSYEEKSAVIACAAFDENGRFIKVNLLQFDVPCGTSTYFSETTRPAPPGVTYKYFIWDGALTPIAAGARQR